VSVVPISAKPLTLSSTLVKVEPASVLTITDESAYLSAAPARKYDILALI
jgi:hypothetical protein